MMEILVEKERSKYLYSSYLQQAWIKISKNNKSTIGKQEAD